MICAAAFPLKAPVVLRVHVAQTGGKGIAKTAVINEAVIFGALFTRHHVQSDPMAGEPRMIQLPRPDGPFLA